MPSDDNQTINVGSEAVESSEAVELLGIKIDSTLNFTDHVTGLIKKGIKNYMKWQEFQGT